MNVIPLDGIPPLQFMISCEW